MNRIMLILEKKMPYFAFDPRVSKERQEQGPVYPKGSRFTLGWAERKRIDFARQRAEYWTKAGYPTRVQVVSDSGEVVRDYGVPGQVQEVAKLLEERGIEFRQEGEEFTFGVVELEKLL